MDGVYTFSSLIKKISYENKWFAKPENSIFVLQLPNLGCSCYWKFQDLRNSEEISEIGFEKLVRNNKAEDRKLFHMKTVYLAQNLLSS